MRMLIPLTFVLAALAREPAAACSVKTLRRSVDYMYTVYEIGAFVDSASAIVRAVADRAYDGPLVSFTVREWIRGEPTKSALRAYGYFVDADDFNPQPVPYRMVRRAGTHGNCYAHEYRRGAEYVLILRNVGASGLTPYWMPLGPSNEQIRGDDDPWLLWVRERAQSRAR
jgi:hypothetical protein